MTIKFNGYDLGKKFVIANVKRPFPAFRVGTTQVEGADGDLFDALTVGPRECSFDLYAKANTRQELQFLVRELARHLLVREPKRLVFSDEIDPNDNKTQLYRLAVPDGTFDFEGIIRDGKWTCRFLMPDPFLYGQPRTETLTDGQQRTIDVRGNAPALPTAKAIVKEGKSRYSLTSKNGHIEYQADFTEDTELTLNFERQTVKTSADGDGLTTGSAFFEFSGSIALRADGGDTVISWTERWV